MDLIKGHKNWQSNTRVSLLFVVMILQNDQSARLCFPIAIFRSTGAGVERGEGERAGGREGRRVNECVCQSQTWSRSFSGSYG